MYWNNTFVNLTCMVAWMMHLFITVFSSSHAILTVIFSIQYLPLTQRAAATTHSKEEEEERLLQSSARQQAAEDEVLSRLNKLLQRMMRLSHWWKLLLRTIEGNVVFVFWFLRKLFFITCFTLDAVEDATLPPTTLGTHDGVQTLSAILCSSCIWCHRRTRRTSLKKLKPLQFQYLQFSDFPT